MPNIQINIKNKVARADRAIIVCDNSDYVAHFDFDAEWDAYDTKTARFVYGGKYTDVVFSGNECPVPVIQDTRAVTVGVFAGDLHTTTPAYFACVPSILCGNGIPADPTPDVYAQIMELLNKDSGVWYPAVDDAGNMSWTRSMSETEPQPVNIKGPKGDAGANGVDGKSAYELAQDNGFVGTMQEWLASLVGADGANGADGKDGISPAVSVAAITGGNRVTITDAEGAKTFDVMDGAQGASGADGKDYVLTNTDKQEIAKTAAGLVDVPSVQHDWNQNDPTAADYIKNRPFYTGDPVKTVLVEESTVSFAEDRGLYMAQFPSTFKATVGETYKAYWDGAAYECICTKLGRDSSVIGNLSIIGEGPDTGEPFVMGMANDRRIQIVTADTSASHTVSISGFVSEVVKIDAKYLPDSIISYISTAQSTANTAQSTANTAKTTAENAQTTAENARSTANTAKTAAENARSTANTAKTAAENAQTTAENARSTANTAKTAAENAQTTANAAKTEVAKALTVDSSGSINAPIGAMNDGAYQSLNLRSKDLYHSASFKVTESVGLQIYVGRDRGIQSSVSNPSTVEFIANGAPRMRLKGIDELIMNSSTAGSTKKFKITVDDSGTITATEVT